MFQIITLLAWNLGEFNFVPWNSLSLATERANKDVIITEPEVRSSMDFLNLKYKTTFLWSHSPKSFLKCRLDSCTGAETCQEPRQPNIATSPSRALHSQALWQLLSTSSQTNNYIHNNNICFVPFLTVTNLITSFLTMPI